MNRRCLGGCGRLITHGTYCPNCRQGTGWGNRDRAAQARFRKALRQRAGDRCEWIDQSGRCTRTYGLRACHFPPLAEGGSYNVTPSDKLYCGPHDRATDPYAR